MKYLQIITYLKKGIKDIEGETIEQKLKHDGWSVKDVKVFIKMQKNNPLLKNTELDVSYRIASGRYRNYRFY